MKWILLTLGLAVGLSLAILIIGWLLPVKHVASSTEVFAAPPAALWQAITSLAELPKWRKSLEKVEVLPDRNGLAAWRETDTRGTVITFEVVESVPPQKLVTRIADPNLPFGGTWTYEIRPSAEGSSLTITENGEVYNPIFRFVSRFIMGHTATMNDYLEALKLSLG
ncbi:MAG: SRPBCC domain-containing protein [Acidobacteriota bacterium]